MSVSVTTLPGLLRLPLPWHVGALLTLSKTPSWDFLQDPCFFLTLPNSCFHFMSSSVFPLQAQEAEVRIPTEGPLSKHVDVISFLGSEQHRSLRASLGARADLQERSRRSPLGE